MNWLVAALMVTGWVTSLFTILLAAPISTLITQAIKQAKWPAAWCKVLIPFIVAAVLGFGEWWLTGAVANVDWEGDPVALGGIVLQIFTASAAWYGVFKTVATKTMETLGEANVPAAIKRLLSGAGDV